MKIVLPRYVLFALFLCLANNPLFAQNPIIDLVNTPNNDVDGEIITCSSDGSRLPQIFLCGENDLAPLVVNILGADNLSWQLLDEGSCTNFGDSCANRSPTCQYTTITTGNSFDVQDDGKYRLRIDEGNGVFRNHYFHVYKNNLEVEYLKADIGCEPSGNIAITNLGSSYAFQLLNADTDQILTPFSAGNGPNFTIGTDGNYRVEVTPLNPSTGEPIENACIFSTPSIAIGTSNFQVQGSATEADCSGIGTVTANLSDGSPNYTYELRFDDGLDGGRGTLIDVVADVNASTYTFNGVGQGDYVVVGKNSDGCEQSDTVTVNSGSDSTLNFESRVSQHITCKEGNILVDPSGGKPPYRYAIWQNLDESDNVVTSYNSPSEIPSSEFQTSEIFDILTPGNYTFVVVDRFGCFTTSNSVDIEFVPPAEFADATIIDQVCFDDPSASIRMNLIDDGGYQLTYYLFEGNISQQNVFDGNYNLADAIAFNRSGFFPGLLSGDYTMVINMRKGSASCDYPYYHTIDGPLTALAGEAILIQPFTCSQTGTIRADNYGGGTPFNYGIGVPGYDFSLDGSSWQSGNDTFIGLNPGSYNIFIRDAEGCVIETNAVEILPVDEPDDLEFSPTQITCADPTSDLTVTVVGGTAPFTFQMISPTTQGPDSQTDNVAIFENLTPDTYVFEVTDVNDCTYSESFTILPITPIGVTGVLDNNVTCEDADDGAVTYTVSGFESTFSYNIINGSGTSVSSGTNVTMTSIPLSDLEGGIYTITVTDDITTCNASDDVTVAAPPAALVISELNVIDITCSTTGTNPGSVVITVSGGWGGYEYELQDPAGATVGPQSRNSFTGLTDTSGDYTVTVRDAGGCVTTQTFVLSPAVSPVLEVAANNLCYDSANGLTLTATVTSGGEAPFQYRLSGGAYQTENVFTGLGPGSYTIEVIDSKNCTDSESIEVLPTLTASAALAKDLDCSPTPEAEIRVNITGGNPAFQYEVLRDGSSVQASTTVPGIPFSYFTSIAGAYEFVITDVENCTITTNEVLVTSNNPPTVIENTTDLLCSTNADGIVELQISGGTPPYQIVFDGSAPSNRTTYAGLTAGTYSYSVTDAKSCVLSGDVTLSAPPALVPGTIDVVTDFRCDTSSAVLQAIDYSGGTPNYMFSIDGVNFQISDTFDTGITAGTYVITIRDANNCEAQTPAVVIDPLNPPSDLSFTQTSPVCPAIVADVTVSVIDGNAPFTYEITAPASSATDNGNDNVFTGLTPGTYTFQVTDDKGCIIRENYTVVDIPRVEVISQLTRNVSCEGGSDGAFTFTVSDFASTYSYTVENAAGTEVDSQTNSSVTAPILVSGLEANTYTVFITDDSTNCTATTTVVINEPPSALDLTFTDTPVTCTENATITVTPTGGWGSYEYQLENTTGPTLVYAYQGNNTFTNVPAGTYTIYVRDSGGCIVDKPITIDAAETPTIALDATSDLCYDGTDQASLVVDVTDGVAPFSYSINGGGQNIAVGNPFIISGLIPGTYTIQVTDAYGCISNTISETIAPQLIADAVLTKALDCTASPDAIIDVTISNGYTPYATYEVSTDGGASWSATTAITGNSFNYTTATAGTYDFRITDNQGCIVITREVVNPIDAPVITALVQSADILCNGDTNGAIQIDLDTSQGVAPFTISVLNTTSGISYGTLTSGLPAGTYEVTVTDANSCTDTETITIAEPDPITFTPTLTDIQCNSSGTDPDNNTIPGSISVTSVAGGTPEYTYYLTANNGMVPQNYTTSPGSRDHTFTILDFGIYKVEIVDANGCSVSSNEIIASPPDDLDIDVSAITTDCVAGGEATVTVSSAFSSGTYNFAILEYFAPPYSDNYQPAENAGGDFSIFTGLTPGVTYTFVVFDETTKCYYFETADAPIDSPSNMISTLDEVSNVTCTGSADGSVSFTIDGFANDATSVEYEIFNFQSNTSTGIDNTVTVNTPTVGASVTVNDVGPLPPGVYHILFTETDGTNAGCSVASEEFTIEEAAVLLEANATVIKNDNCTVNAGEVMASGRFGTAPYEFQITLSGDTAPTAATWAGSSTNVFNVEGGDYVVYVKDANDCIQPDDITVPTDPEPEISVVLNDQCTADEGSFSVDIILDVAGISPHSISIDGAAPQAAPGLDATGDRITIGDLSSGTHTFTLFDQNNCSDTVSVTLYTPLVAFANVSASENCDPANSGEVTVTASGGSGNYSFTQITPAGPTNTTGVFAGLTHSIAYTFEVEDTVTNCTEQVTITLPPPAIPTFTLEPTDVSCFGGSNGTITVNLNAGNIDTPYRYSLDGGLTTQPTNVFNGLSQGTYTVTVISSKGCEDSESIDIDQPSELDISASASAFSCDDSASMITVTINNDGTGSPSGTGPYAYSFDNGANFIPENTYQVPFGSADVTVIVRDANGCTDAIVVPIPVREEVQANITADGPIDCTDNEQIISINATNGSGTYTYTELPSGNIVADPANIVLTQPGTYTYEVVDTVTNCSVIVEHSVAPYDLIEVMAAVITEATCSDSSDGEIEVTITGYTGTFNYQVLDGSGSPIAGAAGSDDATSEPYTFNVGTTFPEGTYSVQITETAFPECVGTSNRVTIDAPQPLTLELVDTINANCNETNAIVTVQARGGTMPYSYGASVSGAGIPASFPFDNTIELDPSTSLDWDIYVRDVNNCLVSAPLSVVIDTDTSPAISLALVDECAAEGSFEITVSLDADNVGVAPYTMSLDGNGFESIPSFPHTYTNLSSGSHSVEIRDANGCTDSESTIIIPELQITAQVIAQPSCDGNDGIIEFTVSGGDGSNSVTLLDAATLTDTGLSPTGNRFIGLADGDYIVRVSDTPVSATSCFADAPVSLEIPTPVTLLTTDKTDVSCNGASDGTITINLAPSAMGVNDNPPYVFEINDGTTTTTQDTNHFIGLPMGTYDITVTSNRNCVATDRINIGEPDALDAAITDVTPFACDTDNSQQVAEIEVTITATTGTAPYFYSVNGGSFLQTGGLVFTHQVTTADDYTIVIRDDKGCDLPLPTITIDPLPVIVLAITEGSADCTSGQEFTVTSTGHSTNPSVDLTFELLETGTVRNNTTTGEETFIVLDPGQYTIQVTDNTTGCYEFIQYEVAPRPDWNVAITAVTPITCFGETNGTLEIAFTGYSGMYDYEVFNADGSSAVARVNGETAHPLTISNRPAGSYFVRVWPQEYPYCQDKETLVETIVSPDEELLPVTNAELEAGCTNDLGEISVVPEGGYAPYDIVITHSGGQQYTATAVPSQVFTGLAAGDYAIEVTDAEGCIWNGTEIVADTPPIDATAVGTSPICFSDPDGMIVVTATGGSDSYNYFINYYDEAGTTIEFTPEVPQRSNEFNNLGEGYYSVTVVDNLGCTDTTDIIHLDGPDQLIAEIELLTPMTCVDPAEVTVTAIGGTAPYEYFDTDTNTWEPFNETNGAGQHTINVTAGTYYAQIRDANRCETRTQVPVIVPMVPPVQLNIDFASRSVACADDMTASIYPSAIGGIGQYTYELILEGTVVATQTQPEAVFENIGPGNYTVRVTSEGGCPPDEQTVSIANPEPLVFDYEKQDVSCTNDVNGSITLMLSGGGGGFQYAISPNLNQFFDEDPDQGLPAGQYIFEDLVPGTYTVIAQDLNGCFFVEDIEIINPQPIDIFVDDVSQEVCFGDTNGSATISITGGTPPYRTAFIANREADFIDRGDNPTFSDLTEGSYVIFVRDVNNCDAQVVIEIEGGANLNASVNPVYECTGNTPGNHLEIIFEDLSVMDDAMYALDLANPNDTSSMRLDSNFNNIAPGLHTLSIASVSTGCVVTYDFEIEDFSPLNLTLENTSINEITAVATGGLPPYTFYFDGRDNGQDNTYIINRSDTFEVRVVDANGCEMSAFITMEFVDIYIPTFFTPDGDGMNDFWIPINIEQYPDIIFKIYDRYGRVVAEISSNVRGWDGLYKTKPLPSGDYWYVVQLNGENNQREYVGHFTLYR